MILAVMMFIPASLVWVGSVIDEWSHVHKKISVIQTKSCDVTEQSRKRNRAADIQHARRAKQVQESHSRDVK